MKKQIAQSVIVGLLAFSFTSSAQYVATPTDVSGAGLSYIVPDMLMWYNSNTVSYVIGPVDLGAIAPYPSGHVFDAYDSVLGDSTFLIAHITYATNYPVGPYNGKPDVCFALALQPAAGGPPTRGYEFYDDYGNPQLNIISARQTGSGGRVAGDKRYGATNFVTGTQCNAGASGYGGAAFQSDGRWTINGNYENAAPRYGVEQTFWLNPATLQQIPRLKAFDFSNGRKLGGGNVSSTFGAVLGLDNGNFAIIADDSSGQTIPYEGATVVIIGPDGSIVKDTFAVDASVPTAQGLWENCAAHRGGFCVRWYNTLYFFDNAGNARGNTDVNSSSGIPWGVNRGDRTRLASDIRSHYVYLAGPAPYAEPARSPVMLGIWDANTMSFVYGTNVNDTDPDLHRIGAVNVAVDALDRIIVGYDCWPSDDFTQPQVVARVMQFDGTKINYLTPSFFPFVNHDSTGLSALTTVTPGLAMTPRQICISGKGRVNSTNNPASGPDTPASLINLYTVLTHPAPVAAVRPQMTIAYGSPNSTISWLADAGLYTLQSSSTPEVPASWSAVSPQPALTRVGPGDATDQFQMTVPTAAAPQYYRLVRW